MGKLKSFINKVDPASAAIGRNDPLDKAVSGTFIKQPGPPPTVVPMPDEASIQAAKKRSLASQLNRTGRASTILSDPSERLGP